ncbi:MAG: preprotein translocase subunit YajC [Mucilaginibacter polytrichastri]|nr:preprotein translocase subunit YajC [Mucilaginibacter polytrichastri]
MTTTAIFLQAQGGGLGQFTTFLPMVLIIIVFYFFMIRPQMKKQKDHKKFVEEIKKGDRVVTIAGIHGRIVDLNETTYLLEVESGAKIRMDRSSISLESTRALTAPKTETK